MTASNLFKCCQPCHGLVLFKHHEPLDFGLAQLGDLLALAQGWLQTAHRLHPRARHPLVLWNALHRAGASQYHGHAQVLLSAVRAVLKAGGRCHGHAQVLLSAVGVLLEAGSWYQGPAEALLSAAHTALE